MIFYWHNKTILKKILDMEFAKSKDYETYILEHLLAIKMKMKTNMIC